MITLHQPPRMWGVPNMSPFCMKLETYLRMAKIEYRIKGVDIKKAPKGRVPYVQIDGKYIGDSNLIIDLLKKKHGDPLDAALTKEQRALSLAVKSMIEDHLYFAAAYLRWTDEAALAYLRPEFLKFLPPVIGPFIFKKIQKDMVGILVAQGMGQHSREEIVDFAHKDMTALSDLLGNRPFFHGEEPTSIDATIYGFLLAVMGVPWDSVLKKHALELENLSAYCERMKNRYWACA